MLAREKLSRKEYLTPQQTKSKFKSKKFKSHSPGYLHIDIKHVPKVDKTRNYLFVAVDRNTRLVTIGIYPKSGTEEAVAFLRHCVDFFEFPLSHVLTDNAACFTDRVRQSRRGPSGKHLFDKACKQHAIEHKLTSVFSSPNSHSGAAPQSQGQPIIQIRPFRKPPNPDRNHPRAGQSLQSQPDATGPWRSHTLRLLEPGERQRGKTESKEPRRKSRTRRSQKCPCEARKCRP